MFQTGEEVSTFAVTIRRASDYLVSHPETPDVKLTVSESERRFFSFRQGDQGIAQRRTICTSHKQDNRLTPAGRKRTLSGRKLFKNTKKKEFRKYSAQINRETLANPYPWDDYTKFLVMKKRFSLK
jgi:hypothetical protein